MPGLLRHASVKCLMRRMERATLGRFRAALARYGKQGGEKAVQERVGPCQLLK